MSVTALSLRDSEVLSTKRDVERMKKSVAKMSSMVNHMESLQWHLDRLATENEGPLSYACRIGVYDGSSPMLDVAPGYLPEAKRKELVHTLYATAIEYCRLEIAAIHEKIQKEAEGI